MKAAFYSGSTGIIAQQNAMDVIGHNLANVNTNGYQMERVSFETLLSKNMYTAAEGNPKTGFGVKTIHPGIQIGNGALRTTGYEFDFAIVGDGFFSVEKNGQISHTRDGEFGLTLEGEDAYLTTQDGWYVLNQEGERIVVPKIEDTEKYDTAALKEEIGMVRFAYPSALESISGNRYLPTDRSGQPTEATEETAKLVSGIVETSGTSVTDEMSNMIAAQRAYQLSARVLQTADENEQTINGLRR